ncbi:tail fiber protein [Escherichia coli]|uniref:tail fiber protein n=1 Tax=Escherichia coli TaxID=562 RepID=UPI0022829D60|nr:tail fiber protein [Escherichia coli]MCZ0216033.1 tail fiber protein [Escherichia coli]MCZ0314082.1 tail fiber protein [Escherichia coli]MCZ0323066.1 tail fiber protein [Escherichia coli]MCZ0376622.1 tail fiber protein [Escherichia coli]MCZ0381182.1 tail fiber protein [Escherichia coli]
MWYREGTVTFTKGSDTISGIGTRWNLTENGVLPGMIVIGPDNKLYEVKRVTSDTVIVLSEPYTGETQSKVPCRIITTYEGDLTQFSARFTALMSRMSADSKSMRSWLTALDDVTIEREDGTEVTVKPLMQIVNEHNENVEWYKNNTDAIEAAGDKAREAAASAVAAAESANTAVEKASQASQSASAAVSSQSAASESAAAAEKSETNAEAAKEAAAKSASVASTKASEAATSASSASASKDAAKLSETNASSSANAAAASATEAANSCKAAKASETNAKASEAAAEQSALSANSSKSAAETSASAASISADSASSSATSAEKSAESASLSAANATAKATEATEQATAAEKSAEAAKSSETNAKTSEDNAAASKETAAESASSASVSASSASSSKDEAARQASAAAESATTASTKATEAADSATAAAQSKNAAESAATRSETAAKRAEDIASAVALEDASTTNKGIVQLSSSTNSESESFAATPKAVKTAYDLANGKYTAQDATTSQKGLVQLNSDTNNSSESYAATSKAVKAAYDNAETRLRKDQNGADIPSKDTFAKNIGAAKAAGGSISIGGDSNNWTTAQFIEWLESQGAFNYPYWMCKGSWSYAANKIITDTGCGNIQLAGAVVEVMGVRDAMTIRVTTPTTATNGGTVKAQFTYINHGDSYAPGWRRDFNRAGDSMSGQLTLANMSQPLRSPGGGIFANDGNVYINKPGFAGWIDALFLKLTGGTLTGSLGFQNSNGKVFRVQTTETPSLNTYMQVWGNSSRPTVIEFKDDQGYHFYSQRNTDNTITMSINGEVVSETANAFRAVYGNYGFFIRNDGANTYFLLTNSGDQHGSWGPLRPLYISNTTGRVTLGNGVDISNGAVINGSVGLGVSNALGGNSIVLGDNDTGLKQNGDGILDVYANNAHVFRFTNGTLQSLKPLSVTGDITSSAWVYANSYSINSGSGAWIDMRSQNVIFGKNAVSTSSAQALLRQDHADRKFFVGGLGNSQFGFYMINNSRTANGTDANAYLQNDGTWVCGGNGNFNDVYIRSDARLKSNFAPIKNALSKVKVLSGLIYDKKENFQSSTVRREAGVVAQELQKVLPEAVSAYKDANGEDVLTISNSAQIALLIEAVKELAAIIEQKI